MEINEIYRLIANDQDFLTLRQLLVPKYTKNFDSNLEVLYNSITDQMAANKHEINEKIALDNTKAILMFWYLMNEFATIYQFSCFHLYSSDDIYLDSLRGFRFGIADDWNGVFNSVALVFKNNTGNNDKVVAICTITLGINYEYSNIIKETQLNLSINGQSNGKVKATSKIIPLQELTMPTILKEMRKVC